MSDGFLFWWESSEDFSKAALTSVLAGVLYLMFIGVANTFQPAYFIYAAVFAVVALTLSGLVEEVNLRWAAASGFLIGLTVFMQSVAFIQGADSMREVLVIGSNIPVLMAVFVASYLAVEVLDSRFRDE
jgi:hypothetical protein